MKVCIPAASRDTKTYFWKEGGKKMVLNISRVINKINQKAPQTPKISFLELENLE